MGLVFMPTYFCTYLYVEVWFWVCSFFLLSPRISWGFIVSLILTYINRLGIVLSSITHIHFHQLPRIHLTLQQSQKKCLPQHHNHCPNQPQQQHHNYHLRTRREKIQSYLLGTSHHPSLRTNNSDFNTHPSTCSCAKFLSCLSSCMFCCRIWWCWEVFEVGIWGSVWEGRGGWMSGVEKGVLMWVRRLAEIAKDSMYCLEVLEFFFGRFWLL